MTGLADSNPSNRLKTVNDPGYWITGYSGSQYRSLPKFLAAFEFIAMNSSSRRMTIKPQEAELLARAIKRYLG